MMNNVFQFSEEQFNQLFPFYLLIDRNMRIASSGTSIAKMCGALTGNKFSSFFEVLRPEIEPDQFEALSKIREQLIIIRDKEGRQLLRGQLNFIEAQDCLLFVGSPWFNSIDELKPLHLTLNDFAPHDPLIDLLHILKTQEMAADDLKNVLRTIEKQRNELHRLSLVIEQTVSAVVITNAEGEIEWVNKSFEQITGYTLKEIKNKKPGSFLQGPDTNPATADYMQQQVKKGEPFHCEILNYTKDNQPYWARLQGQPLRDKNGKIIQHFAIHEDISRQKELEKALEDQRQFYEYILNEVPTDIVVFSPDHKFLFVNPYAIKNPEVRAWIIGKTNEEYVAHRGKPSEIASNRQRQFEIMCKTKKQHTWEELMTDQDGNKVFMHRNLFPVLDDEGNIKLVIGYAVNITELKQIQFELESSKQKTEDMARARQQFLANMSHEIRTPMTAILGIAGLFEKTIPISQQAEYIDIIKDSARNLLNIVNAVLDLEKIGSGKIELENTPFDLAEKVRTVSDSFRYKAQEKNLSFTYQNHLPAGLTVTGDPHRLGQILINLLSNAIKFTDQGFIKVATDVVTQSGNQQVISFSVTDTGIGISPEQQEKIFEPYMQAEANIARRFGGTGLGLSISRELVRMFGGEMWLESAPGEGSSFRFEIPFLTEEPKVFRGQNIDADTGFLKNLRILVAEDIDINQFLIRHILQSWGCEFVIVDNGLQAFQEVVASGYNLVLMDIYMSGMDGMEATAAIRNLPEKEKSTIPIIALTANALVGDADKFKAAGMNGYLPKPFTGDELYQAVYNVLKEHNSVVAQQEQPPATPTEKALYDLSTLKRLTAGDVGFMEKMIVLFTQNMPVLQSELMQAAKRNNWPEIQHVAHKLKAPLQMMGIEDLNATVLQIEKNAKHKTSMLQTQEMIANVNSALDECINQICRDFNLNLQK